ncbi:MAG: hypothetical protein ACI37Q_03650 [Candidatus Gastranaerophilaceae bacterium]
MEKKIRYTNSLTYQIILTANYFEKFTRKFYEEDTTARVSFDEYVMLDTLVCYPHIDINLLSQMTMTELKETERTINKLIKKKLLIKTANQEEKKFTHYKLTESGKRVYEEIMPRHDKMIVVLHKFLSENELLSFTKSLLKIRNILISLSN